MDDFEIPVHYNNKQLSFKARLLNYGYTYKIQVEVNNENILFEPDEERNYRAVADAAALGKLKQEDVELIKKIAHTIEEIVK